MAQSPLHAWLRRLLAPARRRPAPRLTLEVLEDRTVPSVTFSGQTAAVGGEPHAVAVADFNGDGRPDLVTVNIHDGTASVLLNTTAAGATAPSFSLQKTFAVGNDPQDVVVGDFNGDGRPDLAVVNENAGTVSVLLNTTPVGAPAPSFAAPETFAVGSEPFALAVGDFNGDGRADLAVVNDTANGTVSLLLNTTPVGAATASFAARQTFAVGFFPDAVAVGDFNGDGRPDLVVANSTDNFLSVLLNATPAGAAAASFAGQQTIAVGRYPSSVAVAEFNGDGRADIVAANQIDGTASVLLNTTPTGAGAASFTTPQTFAVGALPQFVTTADFNGDGRPDLVVANDNTSGTVSLLLNTTAAGASTPSFAAAQTFAVGGNPVALAAADFNGDGRPDLVVANESDNTLSLLANTTTAFPNPTPVVVADFPGQGVWEYNRASAAWVQLNVSDVSLLAADPQGDVVADFPHYGVWEYHPATGGWTQLNTSDIGALAMDRYGDVVADFPHYGVAEYRPSVGWRMLGSGDATLLAMDGNGNVYGEYPGQGVWELRPASGWAQVAPGDATALAVNASGVLVGSFAGYGTAEFQSTTGWRLLNSNTALALAIDNAGDVAASLNGPGLEEYSAVSAAWTGLNTAEAAMLLDMDANGDIFGAFPGGGVWEFNRTSGWFQLRTNDAALLAVA